MTIRGLLLDVEGVLVGDKRYRPVEGAPEFVRAVRERGLPMRLVTNNTTDSKPDLIDKLKRAGFDFAMHELHTCIGAAVARLRALKVSRCLVLGADALRRMLAGEGFTVADDSAVDAVVVGLDTSLTYERLRLACEAVHDRRAKLIALHRNRLYPDDQGRASPSVGPIVEAIRYATQVEPEVMGKPSPEIYRQVLEDIGVTPESALMVSDDPFSDLIGAKRMRMHAALVLSGKYTAPSIVDRIDPADRPDVIVERIGELLTIDWFTS